MPPLLHVLEMCFIEVTSIDWGADADAPVLLGAAESDEATPVILTSWPTWSANFAVSPVN